MLCDFGLANVVEDLAKMSVSSVLQGSGNCRWMAPELLINDGHPSKESDIWAAGMVFLEVRIVVILSSLIGTMPSDMICYCTAVVNQQASVFREEQRRAGCDRIVQRGKGRPSPRWTQ